MEGASYFPVLMISAFVLGYIFIVFEHFIKINKATAALLTAVVCWLLQFMSGTASHATNVAMLTKHLAEISQVIFFLLGALTIVEIISAHKGFRLVTDLIHLPSRRKMLWVIGILSFFLSAVLDNLTTTIVMLSLVRKVVEDQKERYLIGSAIVIAANAGGAWTPIGDVTTTMLWIGERVSTFVIIQDLFLPSFVCFGVALLCFHFMLSPEKILTPKELKDQHVEPLGRLIFFLGIGLLMLVPIFKIFTGLPPFMGMLFALGVLWLVTDIGHCKHHRDHLKVPNLLTKIDLSSALFFLGILLCIDALETAGILDNLATGLFQVFAKEELIAVFIGIASAIVDNVPLVAACMSMFDFSQYPTDAPFWQMIAYCAGTGGSILIVGSAAGVAFMSIEKVDFFWYLKKASLPALLGYLLGMAVYLLLR